jgi:HEAT repeat protein
MMVLSAAYLFTCKLIWSLTRLNGAAKPLVRALGSSDDNLRMIAGMFLVQAGPRAIPVLTEALRKRENLQMVLSIVASVGDKKLEPYVRPFESDGDANVAAAARHAVEVLSTQS